MKLLRKIAWGKIAATAALLLAIVIFVSHEVPHPLTIKRHLRYLSTGWSFDFVSWELEALWKKFAFGILSPQRFMQEEEQARFVLHYLDHVTEARQLTDAIAEAYVDPDEANPGVATAEVQAELAQLRSRMERETLIAEAILGEQVGQVLSEEGGFGFTRQIFPPVSGTFTPLPNMLVVSPRERIETIYQRPLRPGLTAAEQETVEGKLEGELSGYATYVTPIGGLAAYPSMLLESNALHWIVEVFAHEWTHHYLMLYPLGMYYDRSSETRSINETAASLVGDWAGQEVILRFYAPYFEKDKRLPTPLAIEPANVSATRPPPRFDFRAEMHHTRTVVDRMLSEGKVEEAEWYMEVQRRYFVEHGYPLRRLNQAYFAFHGAYASRPGASGEDPIGPAVQQLWAASDSPRDFLHRLGPVTTLQALYALEGVE